MPAKIETTIHNGELIATTLKMIQERLEEFAADHRPLKELRVSVDVGDPARPAVEIKAPIGEQELVGQASADNVVQAVDGAIRSLQHLLQERKAQIPEQKPKDRDDSVIQVGGVVLAILLLGIVGLTIMRMNRGGTSGVVPVEGTLTYQGEPVQGVSLQFEPIEGNRPSTGITDASGHFVLSYTIREWGAESGKHGITFDWQADSPTEQPADAIAKILEKHGPDGSPLEVEITGATKDLALNIE